MLAPHSAPAPVNFRRRVNASVQPRFVGHVEMLYFDIGTRVKAGLAPATIDTPDRDQQYEHADGDLLRSQANQKLAVPAVLRRKAPRLSDAVARHVVEQTVGDVGAQRRR